MKLAQAFSAFFKALNSVPSRSSIWWPVIREPTTGAWQRNQEIRVSDVRSHHAVYACASLIASDISKCRIRLVEENSGIWSETSSPSFSPVLRKPNHYQTRIKFFESWMLSKLFHGNTYVLKLRDERRVVRAMYILDPTRVRPLLSESGDVYYELRRDDLSLLPQENVTVPASEIIHDLMTPIFHPLVGVSPITACGIAALQGTAMQEHSYFFFNGGARPGGVLTTEHTIPDDVAVRLKADFEKNFGGENTGRVAVLGDGLKYEQMGMSATDSQLVEQLKWSAEVVCSAFLVPGFKIGVGQLPSYNNIEALEQAYYNQCLQRHFESIELLLDEGLGLTEVPNHRYGAEFDLDDLLRMDTASLITSESAAVKAGIKAPNESRRRMGLPPVDGGDTPYLQKQNYSLAALAERDKEGPPADDISTPTPSAETPSDQSIQPEENQLTDREADWVLSFSRKGFGF